VVTATTQNTLKNKNNNRFLKQNADIMECAECEREVEGYEDPYLRNWKNKDGEIICNNCMFEKVLFEDSRQ